MKFTTMLAGTALATLAVASGLPGLPGLSPAPQAEAAVNISFSLFYNDLGRYGDWVSYRDSYVFIPANVHRGWRPYTLGHWVYTKRYGWTWASDEPFGWATYHYGRWGYADDIGWYWVPGKRWAPAWVSWRRSKDYVVWAPLPPQRRGGADVSVTIAVRDVPDFYWVAVPTRRFLEPDIRTVVVHDDREIRRVVERSKFIGTPRITNNIVINNVIDVDIISRETGHKVRPVEVKTTEDPARARASADQVTVFQGEIATDGQAKPQKVVDVKDARKVKRDGQDTTAPDAADTGAPASDGQATTTDQTTTTGSKPAGQAATPPAAGTDTTKADTSATSTDQPAAEAQDQASGNKKKKPQDENAATPAASGEQPAQAQDQGSGSTSAPKDDNAAAPAPAGEQPAQAQDQSTGKKKKKGQQTGEDATGSTTAAPSPTGSGAAGATEQNTAPPADQGNTGKGKDKGKKDQACDPSTDANCAPAQ